MKSVFGVPTPVSIAPETLARTLGVRALTASIFNLIVGAGIFVLPAKVAVLAGPSAPLVFMVCGAGTALVLTCFAIAGSRVSLSGGPYAYIEHAFGPWVGFLVGFVFWTSNVLSAAAVANGFAQALAPSTTALVNSGGWRVGTIALTALAVVNVRGTRWGARLVELNTLAKLLPLVLLIAAGVFYIGPENLAGPSLSVSRGFGPAALLLFFAFAGGEMALQASGEVKDPARTVPRALLVAAASITTFYLAIQIVVQGILGNDLGLHSGAALADAAAVCLGPAGRVLMTVGLAVSVFGWLSGDMLSTPRTLYALAHGGFMPRVFAKVHPRFRTPSVAIVTHAALVTVLSTTTRFERLANLSTVMILVVYLLSCLAAWRLQMRNVCTAGKPFQPAGGRVIPWIASGFVLWLMFQATRLEFLVLGLVFLLAMGLYVLRQRRVSESSLNPAAGSRCLPAFGQPITRSVRR